MYKKLRCHHVIIKVTIVFTRALVVILLCWLGFNVIILVKLVHITL